MKISDDKNISMAIDRAVEIQNYLENIIQGGGNLDTFGLSVNGEWMKGICLALLKYAKEVDGVDIDKISNLSKLITQVSTAPGSSTVH